jgi:hypothetical protein
LGTGAAFGATLAFDAFTALAAFVVRMIGVADVGIADDEAPVAWAALDASAEESGDRALRRAGRADPEVVTSGSPQKLRSQGNATKSPTKRVLHSRARCGAKLPQPRRSRFAFRYRNAC